jgi:hypothetical protein
VRHEGRNLLFLELFSKGRHRVLHPSR